MIIIVNKNFVKIFIAILLGLILLAIGIGMFYQKSDDDVAPVIFQNADTEKPIERGNKESTYIAFACNVDWGNEVIPEMLQILKDKNITITFFVTGRWAKNYPEIFKLIIDHGHEIGSHGYQHLDYGKLNYQQNLEQIKKSEEIIIEYTKQKPNLFAPPSGAYNEHTLNAAKNQGYKTILWSIDTIDWREGSTSEIIKKRVLGKEEHRGAIVLMHPTKNTVKALPDLIDAFREKNIEVSTVSRVLIN